MGACNWMAQSAIYSLGSYASGANLIGYFELGYGSGTVNVNNTTLVNGSIRMIQTGSPDFSVPLKMSMQADFNSVQMSGLNLTEFGLFASGTVGVGSAFARECFPGVQFDGSNELQIVYTLEASTG